MADFNSNNDFIKYGSSFNSGDYSALPMQMLPRSKKGVKWQKSVMDTLETIGLRQIHQNRSFADYRKMQQGRLVYADFDETQSDLTGIAAHRQQEKLPTFLKHYDLIGRIINLLAGEFNKQKDTINIVSTDLFSTGEFLREKDSKIRKFTEDYFNKIIEIGLLEKGLDPNKQDFQSEEERQQYLEELKLQRDSIIPPDQIEKDLAKNFKTAIVEWAEHTLESNYLKFSLDMLDTEELINFLSTGRYFRHYHVGYDSYTPETWDVERTFISEDLDARYPQDGEYAGTIHLLSGAKLLSKFGHLIPKNIQNKIYGEEFYSNSVNSVGPLTYLQKGGGTPTSVPHAAYYQQQTAMAIQNLLGVPWGRQHFRGENGELDSRYSWVNPNLRSPTLGFGKQFRDDIDVRTDTIQLTEAYFKSQKMMGLLTIENPLTELPYQVLVEEDLVPEYLEKYNIKKQSTKSWKDVVDNPMDNINTITYGFLPQVWKGYKINASSTNLKEDYYFGVEPIPYQITGAGGDFDVKLPVAGIITSGIGEMIRSLQIDYNIVMNLNRQNLEKTIGTFFLMDWNLLPSQFKNDSGETTAELVEEWRETVRELGIGLVDSSLMNTKGLNPNQNNIQTYDMSFVNNIKMNLELARDLEQKAFAMIGITPERAGSPNEYMTAEGVKQGMQASYAQTEVIYKRFNAAKVKEKEIELAIAQYAESNKKDISVDYVDNQNRRIIRNFTDPHFSLRKLEVFPADDSSKRRELENFKNMVLQNNTMGNDLYDLAELFSSDNMVSVMEIANNSRKKLQKEQEVAHERQKELVNMRNEAVAKAQKERDDRDDRNKQLDRDSQEYQTKVRARATMADSNTDPGMLDKLMNVEDRKAKERDNTIKNNLKQQEINLKQNKQTQDQSNITDALSLQFMEARERAKDRAARRENKMADERIAIVND